MSQQYLAGLDEFIKSNRARFEAYLKTVVEVPTVSADPEHAKDIERGAKLATDILRELGFDANVVPTSGKPVVLGQLISNPSWPTVTLYNHMDVQPADPEQWQTDPFKLVIDGDRYKGRGTTDDKGPALSALLAVDYALKQKLPLNFNVVWEFEEEVGSPNFAEFVAGQQKALAATNSVLVSDTIWMRSDKPTLDYGLRGLLTMEFKLQTAEQDVHSGLAGGVARNPLAELAEVIAACADAKTGEVKIPGFYDDVQPASQEEVDGFVASGFNLQYFQKAHGLRSLRTSDDKDAVSRIMAQPTFEAHGIVGGYTGPGVKTAIPPTAVAKVSARLVPGQTPERILELVKAFVAQLNPDIEVVKDAASQPFLGEFRGPYADAAREAVKYAFGVDPAFVREGGSIGAVLILQQALNVPIVMPGLSLPEHGYHAPNENFDWRQASGGIKQFAKYFEAISKLK